LQRIATTDNIAGYKGKPSSEDCKLPQGRTGTYRMLSPFDPDSSLGNRPAGVVGWSSLGLHINCRLCLPPHYFSLQQPESSSDGPLLKDFVSTGPVASPARCTGLLRENRKCLSATQSFYLPEELLEQRIIPKTGIQDARSSRLNTYGARFVNLYSHQLSTRLYNGIV